MSRGGHGYEQYKNNAQHLVDSAKEWLDTDQGWKRTLTRPERLHHRQADLAEAQVWATLALAEATRRTTPINPTI